jgi:hypothetical protein
MASQLCISIVSKEALLGTILRFSLHGGEAGFHGLLQRAFVLFKMILYKSFLLYLLPIAKGI